MRRAHQRPSEERGTASEPLRPDGDDARRLAQRRPPSGGGGAGGGPATSVGPRA